MKKERNQAVYIYGKHALEEALMSAPQVIKKVHLAADFKDAEVLAALKKHNISTGTLSAGQGGEIVGKDTAHQGVIALIDSTSLLQNFEEFIKTLDVESKPALAILGEVQDPHNVGAIIRSAAAFGLAGVLIPEHNQAQITGAVVKASAGMVFRVPLVSIGNVNHAIEVLKEKRFWIYGLAADGKNELGKEPFDAPAVFVVGNEGAGIREKTLEACDVVLSIPIHERTESLNAAVSAAVVFYEWSKSRAL